MGEAVHATTLHKAVLYKKEWKSSEIHWQVHSADIKKNHKDGFRLPNTGCYSNNVYQWVARLAYRAKKSVFLELKDLETFQQTFCCLFIKFTSIYEMK